MLTFPNFDPVAFSLGPLDIRWYGISYLAGFIFSYYFLIFTKKCSKQELIDILFYTALGIIFGGRIGYVLFYEPELMLSQPWSLLTFWVPGRSFHGGLLGVIISLYIFAKLKNKHIFEITDLIAPAIPIGIACGRLGNFINGELWGKVTNLPWGMVYPGAGYLPRHPSQIYEFLLEGVALFVILFLFRNRKELGYLSGIFLFYYACMRFIVEFWREPDWHLNLNFLSMGQILSIPMLIFGTWLIFKKR